MSDMDLKMPGGDNMAKEENGNGDHDHHGSIEKRKKWKKTCPEFFTCSNRNRGFSESGLKSFLDGFRKRTNIHFTIHQLRHTFATLMLEGGCDIYSLSNMMGHSDIKTTTIYLSTTAEHLRCQIAKHPLNKTVLQE